MPNLEIPTFSRDASRQARSLGATRTEINAPYSYAAGGLTPPMSELLCLGPDTASVALRVMIRPRGPPHSGLDFVYSDEEFNAMLTSIDSFVSSGNLDFQRGDGFVFGVLENAEDEGNGQRASIDRVRNSRLVKAAHPFGCTFHRAFDDVIVGSDESRVQDVVDTLVSCGFDAILTSGGPGNAVENIDTLRYVVACAESKLQVIVGGGVRSTNAGQIIRDLGPVGSFWLHSSCLRPGSEDIDAEEAGALLKFASLDPGKVI